MADLMTVLREEIGEVPPELSRKELDRILTKPQQDSLADAIAADLVAGAPLLGDLLMMQKLQRARERGIEFPEEGTRVGDTVGDLPTPIDTLGEALIVHHVPLYLRREYGIDAPTPVRDVTQKLSGVTADAASKTAGLFSNSR